MQASLHASKPLAYEHNTRRLLEDAGFIDITQSEIRVPYHHWSRDPQQQTIGDYYQLTMNQVMGLEALSMALLSRVCNWRKRDIEDLTNRVRQEIQSTRVHAYNKM